MPFSFTLLRTCSISVAFMWRKTSVRWPLYASNVCVCSLEEVSCPGLAVGQRCEARHGWCFWKVVQSAVMMGTRLCSHQDSNELTKVTHKSHSSKLSLAEFLHLLATHWPWDVIYTERVEEIDLYLFNLLYLWDLTPLITGKNEECYLLVL